MLVSEESEDVHHGLPGRVHLFALFGDDCQEMVESGFMLTIGCQRLSEFDTGCIVAYTPGVDFNIETSGSLRSMVFGGEGIFLATLSGTGTIWLQSMPIRKLIQAISPYGRNVKKESRSLLDNFLER